MDTSQTSEQLLRSEGVDSKINKIDLQVRDMGFLYKKYNVVF